MRRFCTRLPYPPSVNRYWRNIGAGRTILSEEARVYREAVHETVGVVSRLEGKLSCHIRVCPPDKRRRDLDNVAKAILDSLAHAGVYLDDYQIDDLRIVRDEPCEGGAVEVEVRQL